MDEPEDVDSETLDWTGQCELIRVYTERLIGAMRAVNTTTPLFIQMR